MIFYKRDNKMHQYEYKDKMYTIVSRIKPSCEKKKKKNQNTNKTFTIKSSVI